MEDGGGDTGVMQIGGGHITRGQDWVIGYYSLNIWNLESAELNTIKFLQIIF